ncbi:hypothetical protein [Candidatus Nitrosopumilus sediminis]|uniref:hypothetical protein n=1 Tax=Candidatus Nitrosopumilus sediminis TaxID=1229909 RepID=UPI0003715A01|nr:hypothetical protein [Candidatus Nitrosopumilus sediminis]
MSLEYQLIRLPVLIDLMHAIAKVGYAPNSPSIKIKQVKKNKPVLIIIQRISNEV